MSPHLPLFNTPIETGIRTLVILNASYPISLDLTQLTWLDHLIVHTGDIGGPESLHPNLPQRNGEILVRRSLVEKGLALMRRLHLVSTEVNERGITYLATDDAYPLVDLMKTEYASKLKARAIWLANDVLPRGDKALHDLIADKLGRWNIEFQDEQTIMGKQ